MGELRVTPAGGKNPRQQGNNSQTFHSRPLWRVNDTNFTLSRLKVKGVVARLPFMGEGHAPCTILSEEVGG